MIDSSLHRLQSHQTCRHRPYSLIVLVKDKATNTYFCPSQDVHLQHVAINVLMYLIGLRVMYGTVPKSWAGAVCCSVQGPRTGKGQEYWATAFCCWKATLGLPWENEHFRSEMNIVPKELLRVESTILSWHYQWSVIQHHSADSPVYFQFPFFPLFKWIIPLFQLQTWK